MEPLAWTIAVLLAKGAVEHTGALAGGAIYNLAGRLIALVGKRFTGDPDASQALDSARRHPEDSREVTTLASHLERYLRSDGEFAKALQDVVDDASKDDPETQRVVMTVQDNASIGKVGNFRTVNGDVSF
ncbi:hypothetical protein [Streptomyces griseoloalbus]|uniref:Uncharacterized protein n=1 Tax=Streptomyces griseoloalbus TaxID=67303 RepID=A0A7W8BJC7_9ACTN|nr:hypothetical protein [Streptomyces albaduncus]MBB5123416.1 hypothetical protein [Streptomyces albaduncus]GGV56037.1 hypothetical protein GCM10010294_01260 [Streptomyces griseoloalbus]GGW52350.1 hypothetical protein GCM10010340_33650 [Streptomyces albaduncus]